MSFPKINHVLNRHLGASPAAISKTLYRSGKRHALTKTLQEGFSVDGKRTKKKAMNSFWG